jgi:DNA-binding transcriptional ArsR family regulator
MPDASPSSPSSVRLNQDSVKVLAHPLRSRLVGALRNGGPSTATALAGVLGTNSGATSYHLRKLAEVGLVVDTGEGDGKRRVWAASADFTVFEPSDFEGDEDAEAAFGWLERDWLRHVADKFGRWLELRPAWPRAWGDAAGMGDTMVVATPEQLTAMTAEIDEVIQRYRRVGQGNPEAKRVAVYVSSYPVDMEQVPRR